MNNIEITKVVPTMAKDIFNILLKNKRHINEFLPHIINNTKSVDDELNFIKSRNKDFDDTFVILYNKKIVGMIDIHNIDVKEKNSAEIGYWISLEYQGKGIVSGALKILINHCKNKLKLKKLFAICKQNNIKSQNVLVRNGFIFLNIKDNEFIYEYQL